MTTTGDGDDMSWDLTGSPCKSNKTIQYKSNSVYIQECCADPGMYMLICLDSACDKWKSGSSIEIQGTKYCDPWTGEGANGCANPVPVNVDVERKYSFGFC